ncbi:ABC transporter permease subunit [Suttonella sp. R2A3]|uniref:ABC transporter permease subunit n=1 Tax=Suttonella sp. R2A3 TaxID=2908648 RepID=UPI001F3B8979|nr:ABC transporter permease subunit [Suttonella sp. R2A3]UJF24408.1 ABC transporter permease subunit [Suttonella sp. R2A3]
MHISAHIARTFIAGLLLATLWVVWRYAPSEANLFQLWQDPWIAHTISFSLKQAVLSTLISVACALPLLWAALFGRWQWLRHLLPLTTIIPTLIFILALIQISQSVTSWLDSGWRLRGFHGIIIAHVALNAPLIALLLLPSAEAVPEHYRRQRLLLRLPRLTYLFQVVLPLLRPALTHAAGLVFMLCFTSFTVLLVLGGNPRNANLELAIYQAVKYEFNLPLAAQLALVQTLMLLVLLALLPSKAPTLRHQSPAMRTPTLAATCAESIAICIMLLPLLVIAINAVAHFNPQPPIALWRATGNTFLLAAIVAPCATALHILLAKTTIGRPILSKFNRQLIHAIYLAPVLILCLGLFLLLKPWTNAFRHPLILNTLLLILICQPYLYKLSYPRWISHGARYQRLTRNLHLSPWRSLFQVDLPALTPLLAKVCGFAGIIVAGEVAIISFFGGHNVQTLASYLVAELGHYRQAQAWQTTTVFILSAALLFILPQLIVWLWQRRKR